MLKYLIFIIQEFTITSIFLGLLLGYSYHYYDKGQKLSEQKSSRMFFFVISLIAALILSLAVAIIDTNSQLIKRAYLNIILLLITIVAQILFLIISKIKIDKEKKGFILYLENISIFLSLTTLILYYLVDVLLAPLEFTYDGTTLLSTNFLFKLVGYITALVLNLLLVIGISKIIKKKNIKAVWSYILIIFLPIIFQEAMLALKPMMARRMFPMIRWLFHLLVFVLNNNNIFTYYALTIVFFLSISLWARSYTIRESYSNVAELRKIKANKRNSRRWCKTVIIVAILSIVTLTTLKSYNEREVELSPSEEYILEGNTIKIPLEQIDDGHLHRFTYETEQGVGVRFIVIKKGPVSYGVGLDACEICGATGYYERKDGVVCKRCDVVMNITTIGFKGGCNPIPFEYSIEDGNLKVEGTTLDEFESIFK